MAEITDKHLEDFKYVIQSIERGQSLRDAVKGLMSKGTFYQIVDSNEEYKNQYARACEERENSIFEDILVISDDSSADTYTDDDGNEHTNNEAIQRSRLRIDARKWMLSKMRPKKYGDKVELDNKGEIAVKVSMSKEEAKEISQMLEDEF